MSHLSKIFEEAPIRVQNRNGFDLSHTHAGTSKTGQLVPVLTKLIAPNSTISLGVDAEVSMPPFVSPWYGKVDFAIEGFIVPLSILYGGFKQFITNQQDTMFPVTQSGVTSAGTNEVRSSSVPGISPNAWSTGYALPKFDLFKIVSGGTASYNTLDASNDNIYSYMGVNYGTINNPSGATGFYLSMLPGLAYHKICDTFYRNTKLTRTWFAINPNVGRSNTGDSSGVSSAPSMWNNKNVSLIWHSFYTVADNVSIISPETTATWNSTSAEFSTASQLTFPDGVSFFSTRQRTYARDYFTSAVPSPQQGNAASLSFDTDSTRGEFTINSLRAANALSKFLETNNLSGEYADMLRNRWGIRPIDADFDEPHYLGRVVIPVYQHSVAKQDNGIFTEEYGGKQSPYVEAGLLGSRAATGGANGEGSICDNFNCSCWSYLMVLASLVPHASYNFGVNRELATVTLGDFPAPELQTVGMEEIKNYEIVGARTVQGQNYNNTFGYLPRYSRFKYIDDRISGELLPGRTLQNFTIQRDFANGNLSLGTDFVTIAQNALDNVLAVSTSTNKLTCWWEIYFKLHVVMPLADFCIPTLGELEDTHTIKSTVGGSRL